MICIEALNNYSGYSRLAHYMANYLIDNHIPICFNTQTSFNPRFGNANFSYECLPPADLHTDMPEAYPHITVSIPSKFKRYSKYKHILYTTTETKNLQDKNFIHKCNEADELYTISYSCKDTLIAAGVVIPIHIIYPIVPKALTEEQIIISNAKSYKFLFLSSWMPKKGIYEMLTAYIQAFTSKDDVSLILKTNINQPKYIFNLYLKLARQQHRVEESLPHILIQNTPINEVDKSKLYNSIDALIHLFKCGGFEYTIAEARAHGKPVITTNFLPEILDDSMDVVELQDLEYVSMEQQKGIPIYENSLWSQFTQEHIDIAADIMRFYYNHNINSAPISNRFSTNTRLLEQIKKI